MKYMSIHSFGKCLHNAYDIDNGQQRKWKNKIRLLAGFKFVLVFENDNRFRDWVTEKLYHAFLAGAVPVYWGASNIEEYLPGNHSAVLARDFDTPRALAEYLVKLGNDDDASANSNYLAVGI